MLGHGSCCFGYSLGWSAVYIVEQQRMCLLPMMSVQQQLWWFNNRIIWSLLIWGLTHPIPSCGHEDSLCTAVFGHHLMAWCIKRQASAWCIKLGLVWSLSFSVWWRTASKLHGGMTTYVLVANYGCATTLWWTSQPSIHPSGRCSKWWGKQQHSKQQVVCVVCSAGIYLVQYPPRGETNPGAGVGPPRATNASRRRTYY